jgi:PKD repeat protein
MRMCVPGAHVTGWHVQGSRSSVATLDDALSQWALSPQPGVTLFAAQPRFVYTYNGSGTFSPVLFVANMDGVLSATAGLAGGGSVVANSRPVAAIGLSLSSGIAPVTVAINGSASFDPDGLIANYSFNFGNGLVATGAGPHAVVFSTAGTFTVTLTVTDNRNATATQFAAMIVYAAPPPPNAKPIPVLLRCAGALPAGRSLTSHRRIWPTARSWRTHPRRS